MARGQKIGGHVAGTPNRKTQEMSALLESLCNPIEGLAQIAMNEAHSPELREIPRRRLAAPLRLAEEHPGPDPRLIRTASLLGPGQHR
jgi:hypothetical protein